jgi:hypothetical protein
MHFWLALLYSNTEVGKRVIYTPMICHACILFGRSKRVLSELLPLDLAMSQFRTSLYSYNSTKNFQKQITMHTHWRIHLVTRWATDAWDSRPVLRIWQCQGNVRYLISQSASGFSDQTPCTLKAQASDILIKLDRRSFLNKEWLFDFISRSSPQ